MESEILIVKAEIKTVYDLKNVSINLNGTEIAEEKGGITRMNENTFSFERTIQLNPGKNSIYISTSNIKGVTNSTTRYINYLLGSSPVITLVSPSFKDSINIKGLTLVRAEIISYTALKTFRIFHNEEIVGSETGMKAEQKDSITYIIESLIPLNKGQNIIYVEAINPIGSASSEKRNITCQLESFVAWLLPASVNSTTKSGMLTIKAEIKTDYDLKKVSINLNGTELAEEKGGITPLNDNAYSFERNIQLNPGKNSIYISTSNAKGVTNSTTRVVTYFHGSVPVITLVSPSAIDSLNNSGIILISAEIVSKTELQTVRIFHNRISETIKKLEQKDSITYLFKSLVPLQAGINTILVEAKNYIGTAGSEKRMVICQLEPIIKWILPASVNSTVESGMLNIKAEIKTSLDLLSTSINLNGTVLAQKKEGITRLNNDTYVFEMTVPLSAGGNSIVLIADNAKGTGYSNKSSISFVPGIISEIKWIVPIEINSETYKPEFPVSATIKTKSEIKRTLMSLNGTELVSGERSKITRKKTQEYVYENALTLKPGVNTIDLSAITDAGTINSEKLVITYMAPTIPVLAWKNPVTDQSVVNQPSMDIKLDIKTTVKLENIVVYLNEKPLENISLLSNVKKENGDFILGSRIALKPGDNKIFVVAGNVAGTAKSELRNIKYFVPTMPVIAWRNPETSVSSLSSEAITIRATITSTTDLQNIKLFHNDKLLAGVADVNTTNKQKGEYSIEKTITLNHGENRIYIVAENSAGSSTSETRSLNYVAPAAPAVTWISPARPYTDINLNSGKIRATIKSTDKLQSLLVYVNGVATEEVNQISSNSSQGEYSLEKSINLQPGENNIYLMATNNNGTTKSDLRYLTNPPANPPVISWTNPTNTNAIVNSEIIVIEACIKSATDLKSAKIIVNGVQQASEMMFQAPQTGDCNYILSKPIILKEGDNTVYIIAENFAGSNPPDKRLIRFETLTIVEKRLALIIGNSDYGSSNVLKNPVNDANLIEGTLKTLGFNVIKRINATKNEMNEALREFSKKLPEYNVALFYYAGHGVQIDGQNYLVPIDAALNEPADCKWEALRVNDVVEEFEKVPENINIVILDACRNNPFRSWSRGGAQGFRAINSVSGTIISFATAEGSTAADGSGFNGTFTEELVKQINIPQSLSSVFNNTRKQVMKKTNNLQRPLEMNGLTGDFYFKK